jgi:hypothetical protein
VTLILRSQTVDSLKAGGLEVCGDVLSMTLQRDGVGVDVTLSASWVEMVVSKALRNKSGRSGYGGLLARRVRP